MIRIGKKLAIKFIYILVDVAFAGFSIFIACRIREAVLFSPVNLDTLFFDPINPFRFIFLFWILAVVFLNSSFSLYQTKREIFETVEVWRVIKSVCLASLMVIVVVFTVKLPHFPRTVLFLGTVFMFSFLSLWRILKRIFVEYLVSQGYNNFNVLIIGAGKIGESLVEEIRKKPALGLNIVGYLDDFKENGMKEGEPRILGKISDFVKVAREEFVNKIFITCHHDGAVFLKLLEQAKALDIAVRVVPHGFELMTGEFSKYNIGFIPILEYCDGEVSTKQVGKRLFDFVASTCLTVLMLPVFLLLAALIKLDSPGPVMYSSRRYGRAGRMFYMYKFRSMRADANDVVDRAKHKNEVDGPIFKMKNDPRVTKIGRILRKYSMDELPQLLNVVKGNMSLVGPRPLPIAQVQKEDFRQLRRLEVRPGITGLWQIRGRSDISFARLVKWDIWYINNWSFWLDLNILLQTVPVVFKGSGAY